jgi:hypothetical protein
VATDPRSLIGGHATGNLSIEERRQLYRAALHDQDLFDALVDEEPVRELLEDQAVAARLRAVMGQEEPRRTWAWFAPSLWMPAAVALLLAVAVIPLVRGPMEERTARGDGPGLAGVRPSESGDTDRTVAAVEWVAGVSAGVADPRRLTIRAPGDKELGPLRRGDREPTALRFVPDRSGRAMVVAIDEHREATSVYPGGDQAWVDVSADTPVVVPLPEPVARMVEFRLLVVDRDADVDDLQARLDEGRAAVYTVRAN